MDFSLEGSDLWETTPSQERFIKAYFVQTQENGNINYKEMSKKKKRKMSLQIQSPITDEPLNVAKQENKRKTKNNIPDNSEKISHLERGKDGTVSSISTPGFSAESPKKKKWGKHDPSRFADGDSETFVKPEKKVLQISCDIEMVSSKMDRMKRKNRKKSKELRLLTDESFSVSSKDDKSFDDMQVDEPKDAHVKFDTRQKHKKPRSATDDIKPFSKDDTSVEHMTDDLQIDETIDLPVKRKKSQKKLVTSKEIKVEDVHLGESKDNEALMEELRSSKILKKIQQLMEKAPYLNPNYQDEGIIHSDIDDEMFSDVSDEPFDEEADVSFLDSDFEECDDQSLNLSGLLNKNPKKDAGDQSSKLSGLLNKKPKKDVDDQSSKLSGLLNKKPKKDVDDQSSKLSGLLNKKPKKDVDDQSSKLSGLLNKKPKKDVKQQPKAKSDPEKVPVTSYNNNERDTKKVKDIFRNNSSPLSNSGHKLQHFSDSDENERINKDLIRSSVDFSEKDKASNSLRSKAQEKLKAAKFRYLNEKLYTETGQEAFSYFQQNRGEFHDYHQGYRSQVSKWPMNPVDKIIEDLQKLNKEAVIVDMGCGEAKIAHVFAKRVVHSFDLIAVNNMVSACDISRVPLPNESADVVVFCLSLMGTNLKDYLREAHRLLKLGGTLKIAEVVSRIESLDYFISCIKLLGFAIKNKNVKHKLFVFLDFVKERKKTKTSKACQISLRPCLYKKR